MIARTADAVIAAFDQVLQLPAALPAEMRETVYQWLALLPGFRGTTASEMSGELRGLCAAKQGKGLL